MGGGGLPVDVSPYGGQGHDTPENVEHLHGEIRHLDCI